MITNSIFNKVQEAVKYTSIIKWDGIFGESEKNEIRNHLNPARDVNVFRFETNEDVNEFIRLEQIRLTREVIM
jgi:hypothetical protein